MGIIHLKFQRPNVAPQQQQPQVASQKPQSSKKWYTIYLDRSINTHVREPNQPGRRSRADTLPSANVESFETFPPQRSQCPSGTTDHTHGIANISQRSLLEALPGRVLASSAETLQAPSRIKEFSARRSCAAPRPTSASDRLENGLNSEYLPYKGEGSPSRGCANSQDRIGQATGVSNTITAQNPATTKVPLITTGS